MKLKHFIFILFCFVALKTNTYALNGIDVSEFQGEINFQEVKNSGIEVVYIRSSASNSYIDNKFERNYLETKKNNLKVGFYHYVTARNTKEAEEQAKFFASVIKNHETDCLLAMDFESFPGLSKSEINEIALTFLKTLEELTDTKTIVYSDAYNAAFTFDENIYRNYPLWIAEYDVEKPKISNWDTYYGWQYTDKGRIEGISHYVDRDYFKEDILIDTKTINNPNPSNTTKTVYYRVKKGDTLSKIALIYNVPLETIIKDNNIIRPNLIYPNEVIKINTDYEYQITSKGTNNIYSVKRGDTLTKIANIFHVTVSNLVTWNNIKNPNLIYINEKITIKPTNNDHLIAYKVKKGDTLSFVATSYKVSIYELQKVNKLKNINYIIPGEIIYIPETYIY
ncbi:MAG: LysM peptidoglycan-binding domain-containing protein [Ruminococcus sp.]|nr:LysM peptidoglycan-binding domain-containing protein [Ruminococcus sp.]